MTTARPKACVFNSGCVLRWRLLDKLPRQGPRGGAHLLDRRVASANSPHGSNFRAIRYAFQEMQIPGVRDEGDGRDGS